MRYTNWAESNLHLQGSSAETYNLIRNAKRATLVWTLGARVILIFAALVLVNLLGASFGIVAFEGPSGWISVVTGFALAELIARQIDYVIITGKIRKLADCE